MGKADTVPTKSRRTLRPHQRLRERSTFVAAREQGRIGRGRAVIVNALPVEGRSYSRLGIITTRRVGGAVERSRLRRVVREFFRAKWAEFGQCADIVVVPREVAARTPTPRIWAELDYLCRKTGLTT